MEWDIALFHLINNQWSNGFLDAVMPFWRAKLTWIPVYVFFVILFITTHKKQSIFILLAVALTIGITDQISSQLIKKSVQRPRPCHTFAADKGEIRVLVDCGSGFSFPSSHSANHFALATILLCFLRRKWRQRWIPAVLFFWAFSIGYAQMYVGVHYPLDVLAGALLGLLVGFSVYKIALLTLYKQVKTP